MDEGEFNKIQKSLGDKYCQMVNVINGKSIYQINTDNCLALYENIERLEIAKAESEAGKELYSLSLIMLIVVMFQSLIGILQLIHE